MEADIHAPSSEPQMKRLQKKRRCCVFYSAVEEMASTWRGQWQYVEFQVMFRIWPTSGLVERLVCREAHERCQ